MCRCAGEAAYSAESEQPDSKSATENTDESVVDAEFEEVDNDDDKKSKAQ